MGTKVTSVTFIIILIALLSSLLVCTMRCRAPQARLPGIRSRKTTPESILAIPVNRTIPELDRLLALRVKLQWNDIPFESFNFQDTRQQLARHTEKKGGHEVVLKIKHPKVLHSKDPFPTVLRQPNDTLGRADFITPDDIEVKRAATEATSGVSTTLAAVRAIAKWVSHNVRPSLITNTLSGAEVVDAPQDKCAERATLFASMATSVGIPTRIVLGLKLLRRQWVGHIWNEAFVGYWITVDATTNQIGDAIGLLKLKHSNTVSGAQPLLGGLVGNLTVSIEKVHVRPSTTVAVATKGGRWVDDSFGCRFTLPSPDWVVEQETRSPRKVILRIRVPQRDKVYIYFVAAQIPPGLTSRTLMLQRLGIIRLGRKEFMLLYNKPISDEKLDGQTVRFRYVQSGDNKVCLQTETMWVQGNRSFLLNLIAEENAHRKVEDDYQRLIDSFRVMPREQ